MTLAPATMPPARTSGGPAALPVELLRIICEAADRKDLYSIGLLNKTWNYLATPELYSKIDLQLFHASYTVASDRSQITMQRDLVSFVEVLMLYDPASYTGRADAKRERCLATMERRLTQAVPRMQRLRSFMCRMNIYLTPETFITLVSGTLPHVRDIDIDVSLESAAAGNDGSMAVPNAQVGRPGLKTLKLRWYSDAVFEP